MGSNRRIAFAVSAAPEALQAPLQTCKFKDLPWGDVPKATLKWTLKWTFTILHAALLSGRMTELHGGGH